MRTSFMSRFSFWICINRLAASTNSFPDSFSIGEQSSRRLEDAPDYYTLSSGNCTVPIASEEECQEAAVAMGFIYGNAMSVANAPQGCVVAYGAQVVYNNIGGQCSLLGEVAQCLCANTFYPTSEPTRTFSPTYGPTLSLSPTITPHPTTTPLPSNYPTIVTPAPSSKPTGSNDRYGMKFDTYTLRSAVSVWCSNETLARAIYGDIKDWDTSGVTDMSYLFSKWDENDEDVAGLYCSSYETFNGDISAWNRKSLRIN